MKKKKTEFYRNCPECGEIIYYKNKYYLNVTIKNNTPCSSCGLKARNFSPEAKKIWKKRKLSLKYNIKKVLKHLNKEKFVKNCPKCGKEMCYKYRYMLNESLRENKLCKNCANIEGARKQGRIIWSETKLQRNCPQCGKIIYYADRTSCYRGMKTNALCASCCQLGRKATKESIVNLSKAHIGIKQSKKSKQKKAETMRKIWQDEDYIALQKQSRNITPNKAEKKLGKILNELLPNEYKFVGNWDFILGGRNPDFLNINGKKKLIELYGDYFHNPKFFPKTQTSRQRINHFRKYAFDTLIIWEKELKDVDKLKQKILQFNLEKH